jgi:superfamily II DNA or RNA helicase
VHSRDGKANERVFAMLERHELDVIVQVRKLGEGFDHPYLSVAAVLSIFANLSPFVQFIGRIMRIIPGDPVNQGTVVFHAGANVASRWADFQTYSQADQEFFQQLLPIVGLEFENADELEIQPGAGRPPNTVEVRGQSSVLTEEIPLIKDNAQAMEMLRALRALGYSADQVRQGMEELEMIPTTKQAERKAMQEALDARVKNEVGRILGARKINPRGKGLDKRMPTRESFAVVRPYVWAAFFLQGDPRSFQGRDPLPLDDAAARGRHR